MDRAAFVFCLSVLASACNTEHDTPVPPPPPESAAPAATTTTAPATTPTPTPAPPTSAAPTPPAHEAVAPPEGAPVCVQAFHCCEAAIAHMPLGGLGRGCAELREADESRAQYCREAITTYRSALSQLGEAIPTACHEPH